jgi:dienelactone hydrolase
MAEVLIFHHALGLTQGIHIFAEELRKEGHTVHVPDLFEGRLFPTIQDGLAYVKEMGFEEMMERGERVASELPRDIVYAGFSLGVLSAQKLAQTREGAIGALMFYSCVPTSMFGSPWPADLPAQIHSMDADPYFVDDGDMEAARELVASADHVELFLYPGDGHCFADSSLPSYDPDAAALLMQRVLAFLRQLSV